MRASGFLLTAACTATIAGAGLAGCGGDDNGGSNVKDEAGARAATRTFLEAVASGTKGTDAQRQQACDSLAASVRTQIETVGKQNGITGCAATLKAVGTAAGADQYAETKTMKIAVTVKDGTATASYSAPSDAADTSVTLKKQGDAWQIVALPTSAQAKTATAKTPTIQAAPIAP
jgi:hypothetical protein